MIPVRMYQDERQLAWGNICNKTALTRQTACMGKHQHFKIKHS